jgi:hypothetical protein
MVPLLLMLLAQQPQVAGRQQPSPFFARVQVFAGGDDASLNDRVKFLLTRGLETIDGVIVVGKAPDYLVVAHVLSATGGLTAISITVEEDIEKRIVEHVVIRPPFMNQLEDGGMIFALVRRTDHTDLRVSAEKDLPSACADIVKGINATTFERERQHPRGEAGFDAAFENFLLRSGVIKHVDKDQK